MKGNGTLYLDCGDPVIIRVNVHQLVNRQIN